MKYQSEIRRKIRELCGKALAGELDLDEFYEAWPESAFNDPFYDIVYEDIEDGIEHTPGYFFKKGVNFKQWRGTDLYFKICLDKVLLSFDRNAEELMQCRSDMLKGDLCTEEDIQNKVREYFK